MLCPVTFCNTPTNFTDIIPAETLVPKPAIQFLCLHAPLHTSMHFWYFQNSLEPRVHTLCTFLVWTLSPRYSFNKSWHLFLLFLIVPAYSWWTLIMIHVIASHVPSMFLPCSFQVLSLFFVLPWLQSTWVYKFPVSCMFPHSEYWICLALYSTQPPFWPSPSLQLCCYDSFHPGLRSIPKPCQAPVWFPLSFEHRCATHHAMPCDRVLSCTPTYTWPWEVHVHFLLTV